MVSDEIRLLEGYLSDIREDIRGLRSEVHSALTLANKVDAEQGVQIAGHAARIENAEQDIHELWDAIDDGRADRSAIWQKVWQFGITGALIAQIVMGNKFDSVIGR